MRRRPARLSLCVRAVLYSSRSTTTIIITPFYPDGRRGAGRSPDGSGAAVRRRGGGREGRGGRPGPPGATMAIGATMPPAAGRAGRAARARGRPVVRRGGRGVGLRAGATAGLHVFETAARAEGLAFTSFLEGLLHGLEVERMQPGFLGAVSAVRGAAPGGGGGAED